MLTPNPLCLCGCGAMVSRPSHRFYHGHYRRWIAGEVGKLNQELRQKPQAIMTKEDMEFEAKKVMAKKILAEIRKYVARNKESICGTEETCSRCPNSRVPGMTICELCRAKCRANSRRWREEAKYEKRSK